MTANTNSAKAPIDAHIWRNVITRLIRSEMTKRGVKYDDLSQRLGSMGTKQTAENLRNKINRGILGSDLLIQILIALNVKRLEMEDVKEVLTEMDIHLDD